MIRIAITVEAFEAIVAALPFGTVAYELEPNANGERLIWLEEVWINKLDAPYACPASRTATSSCGSPSLRRPKDSLNGSRGTIRGQTPGQSRGQDPGRDPIADLCRTRRGAEDHARERKSAGSPEALAEDERQ